MNSEPANDDQHAQAWIDSLLHAVYGTSKQESQSLVSAGLKRIEQADSLPTLAVDLVGTSQRGRFPRSMAIGLATVALILVAVSLPWFDRSASAMAIVRKSLDQALVDVGRHYRVESRIRLSGSDHPINCKSDLYVKGGSRFAWRQRLLSDVDLWLGSQNGSAWVVPPIGPVILGDEQGLVQWASLQKDLSSPHLHISSMLRRMRDQYKVEYVPHASSSDSAVFADCEHVTGTLIGPRTDLAPDQVDLWTDIESGVAQRVTLRWNLPESGIGWESITITLVEEAALPVDFFTAAGHGSNGRPRIRFNSGEIQ